MSFKNIVVSGANGFIGTKLVKKLNSIESIERIYALVNGQENLESLKILEKVILIDCELSRIAQIKENINTPVSVFFHLAWIGANGPNRDNENLQVKNIEYSIETLKIAAELKVDNFVFVTTLIEKEFQRSIEKTPLIAAANQTGFYSSAKIAADYMLRVLANRKKVKYIQCTLANVYGPDENNRFLNKSIISLLKNEHVSFTSGEQTYDFIYIDDVIDGLIAVGRKGKNGKAYYLGSLSPRPLKEFLLEARDCVNPQMELGLGEIPFNGESIDYFKEYDVMAVMNDTGFTPSVGFQEGIKKIIESLK